MKITFVELQFTQSDIPFELLTYSNIAFEQTLRCEIRITNIYCLDFSQAYEME